MGNGSTIVYQEIEITDLEGLKNYLSKLRDGSIKEYKFENTHPDSLKGIADSVKIDEENHTLEFDWDDWKINTYWYSYFVTFCRDVAQFIEGMIELECDAGGQNSKINWDEDGCTIEIGEIKWEEYSPDHVSGKLPARPKFLQELLDAKKL